MRVTRNGSFDGKDWALENPHTVPQAKAEIYETAPPNFAQDAARLGRGRISVQRKAGEEAQRDAHRQRRHYGGDRPTRLYSIPQ